MSHRWKWMLSLLLLLTALPAAHAEEPVVRAVLFWAESCPHCHIVLEETLPPLQEEHGEQMEVLTVEVSEQAGYDLWMQAIETMHISTESVGVPMLVVGEQVLAGSYDIPQKFPGLIEQYLTAGGVGYPPIPGLEAWAGSVPAPSATPSPTPMPEGAAVHLWLFYSSGCDSCTVLKEEILPPILDRYAPGQMVVAELDVDMGYYDELLALEAEYGVSYGSIPEIFVGNQALMGNEEIQARLPGLIDQYLAQGGMDLVPIPQPGATPSPAPGAAQDPPVHLAYFYQPGCRECDRVGLDLNYLQGLYPGLAIEEFDVKAEAALSEWLGARAGVPEKERLTAPAVFVGDEALVGEALTSKALGELVARYAATGAEAAWEGWEGAKTETTGSIVERFRSFGVLTVLAAGLVDGLNPCAFATIVFFISYLALVGRGRREILAVGAAFALGVFLTYLGVGFGLLKFLGSLPFLTKISPWLYGVTALLCLILAAGSLYDWWQARRGKPEEMRLKLPLRMRKWINRVIREGAGLRAFVPVAFVTGAAVSLIELACTGQVYLPTIIFVLGVPDLKDKAALYLILYNLMFVLPLVVVFLLAYLGTTSQQLAQFISRRAAAVKLATAALFLLLAGWLVVSLV